MNVIISNCRVQFTAEDIDFIVEALRPRVDTVDCLVKLLADEDTRDQILDDETLFHAVLEHRGCLKVSTHFYFYILVRQVLCRSGIKDRAVADYVAEVLAEFSRSERMQYVPKGQGGPLNYFFEMLAALQNADETTCFYIRTHIGNQSLFMSGIFPDRIRHRAETKGFPDLRYYEELGRSNYRVARDHRLARKYDLDHIFDILSERFRETRKALNDLGDRLISLSDDASVNHLLTSGKLGI
ncbi:MAG TPA: hypothetical protein VMZ27_03860 [Candidatus Saccharimonadales bacterium]|nr:hypothetical protein [Candidatus Saccharimonadales bacterium]